jgi:ribosomal protein S18 acetylase RimI-like enzyme
VPIQPTTRRTYRQAARLLARAFVAEPVSQRVYRRLTPAQQLKNLTLDFTGELSLCVQRGEPLELCQNGTLVAAAAIYPPGAYPLSWFDDLRLRISTILGHTRYDLRAWEEWTHQVSKLRPQIPHYYLEYIGVDPPYQGQGLGSRLLSEITRRADAAIAGCYLETATPRTLPLYERFGFQVTNQIDVISLTTWCMWRPSKE